MASGLLALKAKFAAAKFLGFLDTTPEGIANFTMMGLGRKSPERALIFLSDIYKCVGFVGFLAGCFLVYAGFVGRPV